jgi:uncharacterized membrane protein YkvA (DUF1232 family)
MDKIGTKGLRLFESRAAEYIKDKSKVLNLINLALRKGRKAESFKVVWEQLQLGLSVLKDWANGEYKEIPKRSIIILTAALLYFITPADLVPDIIPLSGYLDDVTVIGFVYAQIKKDLDQYRAWKDVKEKVIESQEAEQKTDSEQEFDSDELKNEVESKQESDLNQ